MLHSAVNELNQSILTNIMKTRIIHSFLTVAGLLSGLLFASCDKEGGVAPETPQEPTGLQSITLSVPSEPVSRTTHEETEGGVRVKWSPGDIVRLVPKNATGATQDDIYEYVYNGTAETETARFDLASHESGQGLPEGDFYAFFGNELGISYDNGLQYTLKTNTHVQGNAFNFDPWKYFEGMKAEGYCDGTQVESVQMKSLMTMISLVVTPPEGVGIHKVALSTIDGSTLNANITYSASDDNPVNRTEETTSLEYNSSTTSGMQTVHFLLPPQDLTGKQFQVSVNDVYVSEPIEGIALASGINYVHTSNQFKAFDAAGTEEDPWILRTLEDVCTLTEMSAAEVSGKYVELGNDINMEGCDRMPIGQGETVTDFHFNGKGYKLSQMSLFYTTAHTPVGLIGVMEGGWVRNLKMENVFINGENVSGGIVGRLDKKGEISNITLTNCGVCGTTYIGGVVGMCEGAPGDILLENLTVENTGSTSVSPSYNATSTPTSGGIVGFAGGIKLSGSINSAINIDGGTSGGIIGLVSSISFASGTILTNTGTVGSSGIAGGIFGELYTTEENAEAPTLNNSGYVYAKAYERSALAGGYVGTYESNYPFHFQIGTHIGKVEAIASGERNSAWAGWLYGYYQGRAEPTQEINADYQEGQPELSLIATDGASAFKNGYEMGTITTGGYTNEEW